MVATSPRRSRVVTFTLTETLLDAGLQGIVLAAPSARSSSLRRFSSSGPTSGLNNHRVRLLDEAGRAMISDDEAADSSAGFVYRISLPSRSRPATGTRWSSMPRPAPPSRMRRVGPCPDQRFEFQVAGEKEKPAPPPKPTRKRRH